MVVEENETSQRGIDPDPVVSPRQAPRKKLPPRLQNLVQAVFPEPRGTPISIDLFQQREKPSQSPTQAGEPTLQRTRPRH